MGTPYRTVRLIRNQSYPTYQLRATMANSKTSPQEGLRLAALTTMDWLRQRLGENAPEKVLHLPEPADYRSVSDESLVSFHIHSGYVVDVVSLPAQGIWTLQITEPDLGSDPGDPGQARQAVPGRVIETNIGYRVIGTQLECGFQTVVSDPEGTEAQAEVYRLAVVRQLLEHPDFGLRQIIPLSYKIGSINSAEQLKDLFSIWRAKENHLPCVIFTSPSQDWKAKELPRVRFEDPLAMGSSLHIQIPLSQEAAPSGLPYDVAVFARRWVTFCRTYQLAPNIFERFSGQTGRSSKPGDIVVLEPRPFGGATRIFPYQPGKSRQNEIMSRLAEEIGSYPRGKNVDFGVVLFLSEARESLLHRTADALQRSEATEDVWAQKLAMSEARWREELEKEKQRYHALAEQLERQQQYNTRLEREMEASRDRHAGELRRFERLLASKDEDIAYLKRKLRQPKEHSQIPSWVEENFSGRLLLHPKAVTLLEDRSSRSVSVELICDALDFLATDYWDRRYLRISTEEMNSRCSEKYGRPFEVTPVSMTTIEFTPAEYKIKYFPGAKGKPVESPLDHHLKVGNAPENLLRIYFLHDDAKKLIVVGSLPRHLRSVTVR